jgi:hypothetical protein
LRRQRERRSARDVNLIDHVLASTPSVRSEFVRRERDFSEYEPYVPLHFRGTDHYAK